MRLGLQHLMLGIHPLYIQVSYFHINEFLVELEFN